MEFLNEEDITIGFKPFDLSKENLSSKSPQIETEITFTNGHESIEMKPERTKFLFYKYSPYPTGTGEYATKREDRNYFKILYLNEDDQEYKTKENFEKYLNSSNETKDIFQKYTDAYNNNLDIIFSNDPKKKTYYTFIECVQTYENEHKGTTVVKSKLGLKPYTNYYYNNELLNEKNAKEIKKTMFSDKKKRSGNEFKEYIKTLGYRINYPQDSQEYIVVKFGDGELEDRKDIMLKIHYREIDDYDESKMPHPSDLTEEELTKYFGEPQEMTVYSVEEVDKYVKGNSFYQFGFYAEKLWGNKQKNPTTKIANTGIKFICSSVNVIKINKYTKNNKMSKDEVCDQYLKGTLDKSSLIKPSEKDNMNVKKSSDDSDSDTNESDEPAPKPVKKPSKKIETPDNSSSEEKPKKPSTKKPTKVESESESDESVESDDSSEEAPPPPSKKNTKKR
jgi:hypothetical protein